MPGIAQTRKLPPVRKPISSDMNLWTGVKLTASIVRHLFGLKNHTTSFYPFFSAIKTVFSSKIPNAKPSFRNSGIFS